MNAEQHLGMIRQIKKRIERKEREVERWHDAAYGIGYNMDGERVQSSSSYDKMADAVVRFSDCESELTRLRISLDVWTEILLRETSELSNPDHCMVLEEYYIHCIPISSIAIEWGRTERHIKRIKKQALLEFARQHSG